MDKKLRERASLWGQVFEIAVQRGVLAYLLHCGLLKPDNPSLQPWQDVKVSHINGLLIKELGISDPSAKEWAESKIRHLLLFGYGLGWTTIREWLKQIKVHDYDLGALWCPLVFPGGNRDRDQDRTKRAREFQNTFSGIYEDRSFLDMSLVSKGKAANADFLLWLKSNCKKGGGQILCLEFSYYAEGELGDYREEKAHREEIIRYAKYLDARGVFSLVRAEVDSQYPEIDQKITSFLNAFSGKDKPFYKLCQAAAYVTSFVEILRHHERLSPPCGATAIAVTSNGLESISARFDEGSIDPRIKLMYTLGSAYCQRTKTDDEDPSALTKEIKAVFTKLLQSLPGDFKRYARKLIDKPPVVEDFYLPIQEKVENFYKPMESLSVESVIESIEVNEPLEKFFGKRALPSIEQALQSKTHKGQISLRDAHAAAIIAALKGAPPGEMRIIALEGNPGIGKTTAVIEFLSQLQSGFLFFYVSPRVVINRDVTNKLAERDGRKTGILTLTTNAKLINAAPSWYEIQPHADLSSAKDTAVVFDGYELDDLPRDNIVYLTPSQEEIIDTEWIQSRRYKLNIDQRRDYMKERQNPGVLRSLARAAKQLLAHKRDINRIVLTAATQGYRNLDAGTTVSALDKLFQHSFESRYCLKERREFSERMPTVIVMVDEVAGDGAGALFCHELAGWLKKQFIAPFEGEECPFRVVLIIADASLSNERVFDRYLQAAHFAPDKVLISPGRGTSPFSVTGSMLRLGGGKKLPTFHVMTNSFPASNLTIDYKIRFEGITPEIDERQPLPYRHQIIRREKDDEILENVAREICQAISKGSQQVIFFAQDKAFLRSLRQFLLEELHDVLTEDDVRILDQSVPENQRLQLVKPPLRDRVKVFLMTSSGSRGVSFPRTDCIIALIPTFNIESALMEVAQLIYRGRGYYEDEKTGEKVSGDECDRRLVLLINDFFLRSPDLSSDELARQWLRKSSDLFTLLVMLRATIYTRIKGDADLRRQKLAFVPVGSVGDDEMLHLMADDVNQFRQEAEVFVCDSTDKEWQDRVGKARELVEGLFGRFNLIGKSPKFQVVSYSDRSILDTLTKNVTIGKLLLDPQTQEVVIPENIYCLGPCWLEDWQEYKTTEQYSFSAWNSEERNNIKTLLGLLTGISDNKSISSKLKSPAKELHRLLIREKEDLVFDYTTIQETGSSNVVIALPLDHPHFLRSKHQDNVRNTCIQEPIIWQKALGRAFNSRGLILPVIPQYKDFPWSAVISKKALSGVKMLFDNRYFSASYELNLLNMILLEDSDR
ncbi:MAG: hypothetical protein N5P05_001507 [Chroococcopsis gigantea SAG 12.99]|jgi:hypothetical protein|nr:hypothetical protein [Chlorogloea purpurea SAG 13.99]MDV2999901.1 hypothetical protein [Chroococcopsis gigantea SAG 12.99]